MPVQKISMRRKPLTGSRVTVFQKNMGAKGVTTYAADTAPMTVMEGTTAGAQQDMQEQQMYRIVLLGDSRAGKSSLANTMFGEDVFRVDNTECQTETKSVHGRRITLINTPDFFSPGRSEEELKSEILRCVTEFPAGPHAFLIVFKVDESTEQQQQAVIQKIHQYFSEEAFKYAAVVFTHDDQVSEGLGIIHFIGQNKCVRDLVDKCRNRFHIINNYNNQSQVAELLNTIDQMLEENTGRSYTSALLPQGDACCKPNNSASKKELTKLAPRAGAARREIYLDLILVVFLSLLLTWYFLKVPFFGSLLALILLALLCIIYYVRGEENETSLCV